MTMLPVWQQWDKQEAARLYNAAQTDAYIELSNTFLAIERGTITMDLFHSNNLRCLVMKAYDQGDSMIEWWGREFEKLPLWLDF